MTDRDHPRLPDSRSPGDDADADVLPDPILGAAPEVPPAAGPHEATAPDAGDHSEDQAAQTETVALGPPDEPTVGTGSVFAIGCGVATLLFVVIAVVVAIWMR